MPTYLDRYLAGEHRPVWTELLALGDRVREEPLHAEASAIAAETMRRVRHNIALLIARLEEHGYRFYADPTEYTADRWGPQTVPPRLATPQPETQVQLDAIERALGPLPISLRAFYEVVGAVNLVGEPPLPDVEDAHLLDLVDSGWQGGGWRAGAVMDPLFIYGLASQYEEWAAPVGYQRETLPTSNTLILFPDSLVKYDISGFVPVGVDVPCPAIDAPLRFDEHHLLPSLSGDGAMHFVEYLRLTLARGGFAGLGRADFMTPPLDEALNRELIAGFLPF